MASRRTRIKGIANIPQRRKPTNDNEMVIEENVKIGENQQNEKPNLTIEETSKQTSEIHNLNSQVTIDNNAENQNISIEINETPKTDKTTISENQQIDNTNDNGGEIRTDRLEKPNLNSIIDDNTDNSTKIEENSQNQALITKENNENSKIVEKIVEKPAIRRKFIKPAVSIGALNRKIAKEIDKKDPKNDETKNKIVILDQKIIEHENSIAKQENGPEIEIPQQSDETVKILPISPTKEKYPAKLTEIEYPIPPPSPNKNRARIKAIPRFSQRHTSFSASESEDESKRNNRHRNDSICSTTSTVADNVVIPEILQQKPKEFHSLIQKKCRRTEQSRKLAEARRDFLMKFGNNKPDRQKLTMMDLIFYNPTTNLMSDSKRKRDNSVVVENKEPEPEKIVDDPVEKPDSDEDEEEEAESLAPQIRIDAQGEIVVDEQSLVIENKTNKKNWETLQNSQIIDGNFETGYGIYKRCKRSKDWTKQETLKFYKALNTLGTDFTLMSEFFPRRSRRELKMKFKKEERINKQFIDRALLQPCSFDYEEFKQEVDLEEKEMAEIERQKQIDSQLKKEIGRKRKSLVFKAGKSDACKKSKTAKKPKKRRLDIMNVLSESDADESEIDSGDENSNDKILENIQRPTRSGRVPKILDRYKCDDKTKKTEIDNTNNQKGSIMVVERTTPEGASIFKVFMVDDKQNKVENGVKNLTSISSLSAELSENCDNKNNTIDEPNITIPPDSDNTENL